MNLDTYTTEMAKSVWDKSFFMDKIPGVKYVIDFGCADGAMIRFLAPLFPNITFVGYDINKELIAKARTTMPFEANIIYFNDIRSLMGYMGIHPVAKSEEICINFSSVLHEIYSSTGGMDVIQWVVDELKPRYITIRDMYCDEPLPFYGNISMNIIDQILSNHPKYIAQFVDKFGVIDNWKNLTHLLMKLQWIDNGWKEELNEDYYSWNINDFIKEIKDNYIPAFECRYQLPYLSEKWKNEYNWYNPDIHTHAQFILRRL